MKLTPGTYQVHVSCVDEHGGQDHSTLTVVVEPNLPPSFTKTKGKYLDRRKDKDNVLKMNLTKRNAENIDKN